MPDKITADLEFEKEIAEFPKETQFLARQVREIRSACALCTNRLAALESRDRKTFGVVGGAGAVLGGAIIAVIDYFRRSAGG